NAGLDEAVRAQINEAAVEVLSKPVNPVIGDPGDELMVRMMSATLGEVVAPEYAPMNREEMGLHPRHVRWTRPPSPDELKSRRVLIVGAGLSGIALGVALKALGIPFDI